MNSRTFLMRPNAGGVERYATKVVDEYSSESYGDPGMSDDSDIGASDAPVRTQSQEFTVDLSPMFTTHSIAKAELASASPVRLSVASEELPLENFNCPETPPPPARVERIERVVVTAAHFEQFPKSGKKCQSIFAWSDAQSSSEYQPVVQSYFTNTYSSILGRSVKMSFCLAPDMDKLKQLASVRAEISAGRILFHYVGYGFPLITPKNIWCSERRSTQFTEFPLDELFWRLRPPIWFVFDCSNAGVVIPAFEAASTQSGGNIPNVGDPRDWMCICATDASEVLPQDPNLPRDFLTSTLFSPVKMAIACHILQHYRSTLVGHKFPLEIPVNILASSEVAAQKNLGICLAAIEDAIAADLLEPELYHRIFRMDRLSAVLFRNFLLAQFLLMPYRVHPVSHPTLPDLSMHPLWKEWSSLVDLVIISHEVPALLYTSQLFRKVVVSFKTILETDRLEKVRAYILIFLFHILAREDSTAGYNPVYLLAEYASRPGANPEILTTAALFPHLFASMIRKRGQTDEFHALCYLVLTLLYHRPSFAMEIQKNPELSNFPMLVFNESLHISTRILVSAIVANLLVSNDVFLQVCASRDYLTKLRTALETADTVQALWLLLLVRRTFHMCPPDPSLYVGTALHLTCSQFINHPSPACRAAAVGSLASLLRPYECYINGQLMFMALPVVMDASYLVRFHLLLLLKRFMISFDALSESVIPDPTHFPTESHAAMMSGFFKCSDFRQENVYHLIDNLVHAPHFLNHAYTVALFLLNYYMCDPHPSVADLAGKLIQFVQNQRREARGGKPVGDVNFQEDELFHNLDQNESLHRIALRNLIMQGCWKPGEGSNPAENLSTRVSALPHALATSRNARFTVKETKRLKFSNICKIAFHQDSLGFALATYSSLMYIDDKFHISSVPFSDVDDIQVVEWDKKVHVIASSNGGSVFVWPVGTDNFVSAFRASAESVVFAVSPACPHILVTVGTANTIYRWDLKRELIVDEWESGCQAQTTALAIHPTIPDFLVVGHKNGVLRELVVSDPQRSVVNNIMAPQPTFAVKKVAISRRDVPEVFSVCENGRCDFWVDKMDNIQPLKNQHWSNVFDFGIHPLYPVLLFSPSNGAPFMTDLQGKVLHVFKGIEAPCVCAFHPVLPILALGSTSGEVVIYEITEQAE